MSNSRTYRVIVEVGAVSVVIGVVVVVVIVVISVSVEVYVVVSTVVDDTAVLMMVIGWRRVTVVVWTTDVEAGRPR